MKSPSGLSLQTHLRRYKDPATQVGFAPNLHDAKERTICTATSIEALVGNEVTTAQPLKEHYFLGFRGQLHGRMAVQ